MNFRYMEKVLQSCDSTVKKVKLNDGGKWFPVLDEEEDCVNQNETNTKKRYLVIDLTEESDGEDFF